MGKSSKWGGRKAQRLVAHTLRTKGTTCVLCGHDDADSADHHVPRAMGGADSLANLDPVHHKPCPTCGVRCNQKRGTSPRVAAQPADEWPPDFLSPTPS